MMTKGGDRNRKVKESHRERVNQAKLEEVVAAAPKLKCPKCGTVEIDATAFHARYVSETGERIQKTLCGNCYVRWLIRQVPEMVPMTNEEFTQQVASLEAARKARLEELQAQDHEKKTTEGA